jgi:uroporphyrinogen decarboxylase
MIMNAEQIRRVVRRQGAVGIPIHAAHTYNTETRKRHGPQLQKLAEEFPEDCVGVHMIEPGVWDTREEVGADYRWAISPKPGNAILVADGNWTLDGIIDHGQGILPSCDRLDDLLAHFEQLDRPEAFAHVADAVKKNPGRYVIGGLNHNFYDRMWKLHGVTSVMMDFHLNPDKIHQLGRGILDLEKKWVRRYAQAGVSAVRYADDYGCQLSTLFSPTTFREFFKPLYAELSAEAHRLGLDVWMHSCGNLSPILGDFAEAGIDMMHPIQVGCFDEDWVLRAHRGKIGFHLGMDVQHLLPEGTPKEVERGCRDRLRFFMDPQGGVAVAAGNAIMPETPWENIRAFHHAIREFREGGQEWYF